MLVFHATKDHRESMLLCCMNVCVQFRLDAISTNEQIFEHRALFR